MKTALPFQPARLFLAVAAGLVAFQTVAETSDNVSQDNDNQEIEEVYVWGTAVQASSVNLQRNSIAIKQADHISDLLRTIPGVDVGGAHSLNQRITIRSMDDKDLDITIDGARQNTYMYHHMGNLQIHADILESVDIEVGKNSVINGGLGGTVRFRTKSASELLEPGDQFGGRAQAGYNTNSGSSLALTGYGQLSDELDVLLYHNRVNRDNYEVGGGKIKDANGNEVPGTNGKVEGLEGTQDDTLIKFGLDINEAHRISFGYERYRDEGDYSYRPDMGLATDTSIAAVLDSPLTWPTNFDRDTLTLNYSGDVSATTSAFVTLYENTSTLKRDESAWLNSTAMVRGNPASDSAGIAEGEARLQGLNILMETALGHHILTYGAEHTRYNTDYEFKYSAGTSNAGTKNTSDESSKANALFVEDSWNATTELTVIAGVRYDSVSMDTALTDDTFSDVTGGLELEYAPIPTVLTSASYTQLFKAPEVAEVFIGAGLRDSENPDIKAETGVNREISVGFADDILMADQFSAGATGFWTSVKDYIYDYSDNGKDNIGVMVIKGVEAYVGYEKDNFSSLLTFSRSASSLTAATGHEDYEGAGIDRQQGNTFSLNLDYALPSEGITLHGDVQTVADLDGGTDLDSPSLDTAKDGYTVVNVSAMWQPDELENLSLTLGVDNLLDEYYASHSSRTGSSFHPLFKELYLLDYEPGRNVKATVAYQF